MKGLRRLGAGRKQMTFLVVISGFAVLTGHVMFDVVGIASLVSAPRAVLWMSMFAWSMAYNVITFSMLLYEALRIDLKDVQLEQVKEEEVDRHE